jgi:hypothetical protein
MRRKSRVGLGFVLGALCMLGAVFGIKWLAAWAGREGVVIPHVIGTGSGDAQVTADAATTAVADDSPRGSAAVEGRSAEPQAAPPSGASAAPAGVAGGATPDGPSAPAAPSAGPSPTTEGAAAVAAAAPTAAAPGGDAAPPAAVRREGDRPVAGAAAPQGADASAPAGAEDDEDEEALLSRVVPDAGAVVGEDEADSPQGASARKDRTQNPAASTQAPARRAPGRPAATPVVVRITSSPLGAVVRTKRQVLGRTPIAIRFNPGNTYQLTFVKAGYVTSSRMLAVGSGKPKSISVPMKKRASTARRGGLFRGR